MHAQDRAEQRYNKELSLRDIICIQKAIKNNEHIPLYPAKDDKNKKFCYVTFNHIPYKILYTMRKKQCRIITIYPFDVDEYNAIMEQKKQDKITSAIKLLLYNGYTVVNPSGELIELTSQS